MNTEYLTELTVTSTVSEKPTTTVSKVNLQVVTATAIADDIAAGDITILMSDQFRKALNDAAAKAVEACVKGANSRKRQGDSTFSYS